MIAEGRAYEGGARFGVINRPINLAIRPMSDLAQWGVVDRWSAPLETFTTGRGDCEDYAIAKYLALKEAGVAEQDLRLVIVRDLILGQDHAAVVARLDNKWIVLDNRRFLLPQGCRDAARAAAVRARSRRRQAFHPADHCAHARRHTREPAEPAVPAAL